jgi:hypothetical protein
MLTLKEKDGVNILNTHGDGCCDVDVVMDEDSRKEVVGFLGVVEDVVGTLDLSRFGSSAFFDTLQPQPYLNPQPALELLLQYLDFPGQTLRVAFWKLNT